MQRYRNNLNNLVLFDLKSFIDKYLGANIPSLALQIADQYDLDFPFLAEQLKIYPKAVLKLPSFSKNYCFFTLKSFEQSSSEPLAQFKASLFSGKTCLDLSGGLGVDDWAFAKQFNKVISLDKDEELNILVRRNFDLLGVSNIQRLDSDAYKYLQTSQPVDLVYLDADRRPDAIHKRVAALVDTEPNILLIKDRLLEISDIVLLKVSPMMDITAIIKELEEISDIYVISLKNEVKEVLVVLKKERTRPLIHAVNIRDQIIERYEGGYDQAGQEEYSDEGRYFYEPALSLIKSGLATKYAHEYGMNKVAPNTYYMLSNQLLDHFFGRSFEVIARIDFSKSGVKKYLKEHAICKGNIAKRNFPVEVDELKKLFSIEDGGEEYLFFTQNARGQKLMFHCRKLNV